MYEWITRKHGPIFDILCLVKAIVLNSDNLFEFKCEIFWIFESFWKIANKMTIKGCCGLLPKCFSKSLLGNSL